MYDISMFPHIEIGDNVYVGGCVGEITNITDTEVTVSGVYTYYMGENKPGYSEPWTFVYRRADFNFFNLNPEDNNIIWNLDGTRALRYIE